MHTDDTSGTAAKAQAVLDSQNKARKPRATSAQGGRGTRKRAPSAPRLHGKGYAIRRSYRGEDIFLSGFKTSSEATRAVNLAMAAIDANSKPAGSGPRRTSLAQALQDYAVARLPFLKGADQEARRINAYLRPAGLRLLKVRELPRTSTTPGKSGKGAYFKVSLVEHISERAIPNGLAAHRKALLTANAGTDKWRAVLATSATADVTRQMLQAFVDTMTREGNAPATVGLERALLRRLYNYAVTKWSWTELRDNPASRLDMPTVDNGRSRVLGEEEQVLLDAAVADCRNQLVKPTLLLLRETAMRASEPLKHATWRDVDSTRKVLKLHDAKSGDREVPLSPAAMEALKTIRDLSKGKEDDLIVSISYASLSAAWRRALERAGIDDLRLQDLRHTAATRMALKSGNVFLVKALTGHKTLDMLERYVNVGADDVVKLMHGQLKPAASGEPAEPQPTGAPGELVDASNAPATKVALCELEQVAAQAPRGSNVLAFPVRRRA
ncbi:MAG: site-specific integrase [Rubrivivax sp.]|nr:site-specific integrase [Rubrivivax sp.]